MEKAMGLNSVGELARKCDRGNDGGGIRSMKNSIFEIPVIPHTLKVTSATKQ